MRLFAFDIKISFQINSFILVYKGVRTTIKDQVGWLGIYGKGHSGVGTLGTASGHPQIVRVGYDKVEQIWGGGVSGDGLEGNFWEVKSYANFHCFRGTTATQRIESNFDITFNAFQTPDSINSSFEKRKKELVSILKY